MAKKTSEALRLLRVRVRGECVRPRNFRVALSVSVAATVFAVTLLAAYVPARRASLINPTEALRVE